jgi:hypothetical protein
MASTITRTTLTNDTGTAANPNSDGTVLNNAWLQAVYDKIDQLLAGASPYNPLILGGALQIDGQPKFGGQNSATQSLADSTWTALTMDVEQWDTGAMHSTVTNTSRVTIPTGQGGHYAFMGQCGFAANATGVRKLAIARNGTRIWSVTLPGTASDNLVLHVNAMYPATAGDYFELHAYQNSGGALNAGSALAVESIYFMVTRLC